MHKRFTESRKHNDWLAGIACSAIANFSMGEKKEALMPWDFIPWLEAPAPPQPQTPEQLRDVIFAIRADHARRLAEQDKLKTQA